MKSRWTNKTYIAGILVLFVTFLLIGCGTDTTESLQAEPAVVEEELPDTASEESSEENKTNIYDGVLSEYSDMVQNHFYDKLRDSDYDAYENSFGEHIGLEIRTHEQKIFYAFYDIDGNGTEELIIAGGEHAVGTGTPDFSPWNYDLYGYNGTDVVHIFSEMNFGYRTNFSLYENGIIEVFYSSSAAESGTDFYKIGNNGITPELVDSFVTIGHLDGEKVILTYSQNGEEITEEEYNTKIQSYETALTTALDWTEIHS